MAIQYTMNGNDPFDIKKKERKGDKTAMDLTPRNEKNLNKKFDLVHLFLQ